jgi:hypothetical protein
VRVEGLETLDYLDNLCEKERFTEQGDALTFESEVILFSFFFFLFSFFFFLFFFFFFFYVHLSGLSCGNFTPLEVADIAKASTQFSFSEHFDDKILLGGNRLRFCLFGCKIIFEKCFSYFLVVGATENNSQTKNIDKNSFISFKK